MVCLLYTSFTNLMPRELVRYGDTVVILAQGVVGLLCTIFARHLYNAGTIITTDPQPFKREMSLKFGADYALDPNTTNVVEFVKDITHGQGAQVILECIGVPESVSLIPYLAAWGARIGQIGAGCNPVLTDWCYIPFKGLTIYSCLLYTSGTGHSDGAGLRRPYWGMAGLLDCIPAVASLYCHPGRAANLPGSGPLAHPEQYLSLIHI